MGKIVRHNFLFRSYILLFSLLLISIFFDLPVSSQDKKSWQWIKQVGSDSWDISSGIVLDSKNNLYLAGSFYNLLNSDSKKITSSGGLDLFIAKFDKNGDLKAIQSGGGRGNDMVSSICVTPGNNIVIGGVICDTVTFGKIKIPGTGKRLFVSALDPDLNFKWVSTISLKGDASLYLSGAGSQGNIYVSGIFNGILKVGNKRIISNGKKDIFLARLNSKGVVENLYSFGSTEDDFPGSMAVESSGTVFLAGTYGKPFEINGLKLSPGPEGTITSSFICSFDRDFKAQWINLLPGEDFCNISSLKYDYSGNLYAAGSFSSKLYVSDTILVSDGYTDGFILKYFTDGQLEWSRRFGTWYYDYASGLNIDNFGGAVITGSLGDTLNIDSLKIEPIAPGSQAIIIQFSPDGKALWADCISGKGRNFGDGSVIDNDGNLYLTGTFRSTFGKDGDDLESFGDQDIFLAKYFNCETVKADIYGEHSFCPGTGIELSIKKDFTNVVWNDTIPDRYSIIADKPGRYWVRMLDNKGCRLTDTILVAQNPRPVFSLGNDTTIKFSDSILLKAPGNYANYRWNDNSTQQVYTAKSIDGKEGTRNYWLTVTDSLSCDYTDTISVTYLKDNDWFNIGNTRLIIYPNPAKDNIYWYLTVEEPCQIITELTDVTGRVLYHQYLNEYLPGEIKEIDINNLKSGFYNFRISNTSTGENFKTVQIIKL